jgi:hypothetical protein
MTNGNLSGGQKSKSADIYTLRLSLFAFRLLVLFLLFLGATSLCLLWLLLHDHGQLLNIIRSLTAVYGCFVGFALFKIFGKPSNE